MTYSFSDLFFSSLCVTRKANNIRIGCAGKLTIQIGAAILKHEDGHYQKRIRIQNVDVSYLYCYILIHLASVAILVIKLTVA